MSLPSYASSAQLYCGICTKELAPPKRQKQWLGRNLECCARSVCGGCIKENPRFEVYCPFCQSIAKADNRGHDDAVSLRPLPPPYTSAPGSDPSPSGVLHYIHPDDSVLFLSLHYKLPAQVIRNHNRLFSDHLLHARRTIEIPSPPYNGQPLSNPPTGEEQQQEAKKLKVKRFQLKTKCVDFGCAEVYLKEAGWDEELAARNWLADEKWVRENPMVERSTGNKGKEIIGKGGIWGLRVFGY